MYSKRITFPFDNKEAMEEKGLRVNAGKTKIMICGRGDQIFFSATCPGQVACKNPLVLRNFLLVPKYFSYRKSIGQVANTTISLPLNQSCRRGEQ